MSKQINIKDYISMYINEKIDILKNYPITEVQEAVEVIFFLHMRIHQLYLLWQMVEMLEQLIIYIVTLHTTLLFLKTSQKVQMSLKVKLCEFMFISC